MMDSNTKRINSVWLRKDFKPGSTLRWRLFHVATQDNEAPKQCRATAVRATIRKNLRQQSKRPHLAKFAQVLEDVDKTKKTESMYKEGSATACVHSHPPGAMAPANTTQYLMNNVYEDMKSNIHSVPVSPEISGHLYGEWLSPRSVYAELDSGYESCLSFQQRDFDEMFELCW